MSTLLTKYWWYKPNRYTTTFTLTATFGDSTSEYVFNKIGESWEAVGTHDSRLVIILPNANNGNRFIVRAYDNDVFVSLNAEYSNAYSQSIAKPANMARMVFDKSFYSTHLFEPNCAYDNPYDLFNDSDLHDIYFTNLTETITLPNKNSNYGHWYGWGAYNQTKPYSMLNKINDLDNLYRMPLSWIYSWQLAGFPTVGINNSTSSHPGISKFYEIPMVDHKVYMVPLYHNEKPYYDIDTKDYGEPVIPDTPTPPTPSEPDYLCFTANKAGATLRLVGMVNPDYDGDLVELEYSTDGENWHDFEITTDLNSDAELNSISSTLTFSNIGDKVYFRGNNIFGTAAFDIENDEENFTYFFAGGEGTNTEDNEFAISGDIQTIVDKTGQDKTHGQFGRDSFGLFSNVGLLSSGEIPGILITTAPDLTATSLVPWKYCYLFMGQTLLEHPATMPNFTTNQLPHMPRDGMDYGAYAFVSMYYGCTSLQEGCDFSTLTANTYSDVLVIAGNLMEIYEETTFNITDDNGLTLNGFEGISFPFTATIEMDGETMTEVVTSYMFASDICTNTNGFSTITLYISTDNGYVSHVNPYYSYKNDYDTHVCEISIPSSEVDTTIEVEFAPNSDYTVTKWQSSTDGETWTDIPNSDSNTLEITIPDTDYYYKVVTVSAQPNWVEISRSAEPNTTFGHACHLDSDGFEDGECNLWYDIVEEDTNPLSSTYGQQRNRTVQVIVQDTTRCPIPTVSEIPFHCSLITEYDDNGTITNNNDDKCNTTFNIYRVIDSNGNIRQASYGNTVKIANTDVKLQAQIDFASTSYTIDSILIRRANDAQWEVHSTPYLNNSETNFYISESIDIPLDNAYLDIKVVLVDASIQHLTGNIICEYNYDGTTFELEPESLGGVLYNVALERMIYRSTGNFSNESGGYYHGYDYINLVDDENQSNTYFDILSQESDNAKTYVRPNVAIPLTSDYEIYEEYIRFDSNDPWTKIELATPQQLGNSDFVEFKLLFRPMIFEVTVNVAEEQIVNGESTYVINNNLVTNSSEYYSTLNSGPHVNLSLGTNYINSFNDRIKVYIGCTLVQAPTNVNDGYILKVTNRATWGDVYEYENPINYDTTNGYIMNYAFGIDNIDQEGYSARYSCSYDILFIIPAPRT